MGGTRYELSPPRRRETNIPACIRGKSPRARSALLTEELCAAMGGALSLISPYELEGVQDAMFIAPSFNFASIRNALALTSAFEPKQTPAAMALLSELVRNLDIVAISPPRQLPSAL